MANNVNMVKHEKKRTFMKNTNKEQAIIWGIAISTTLLPISRFHSLLVLTLLATVALVRLKNDISLLKD